MKYLLTNMFFFLFFFYSVGGWCSSIDSYDESKNSSSLTYSTPSIECFQFVEVSIGHWTDFVELTVNMIHDTSSTTSFDTMWLSEYIFDCDDLGDHQVTIYGQIGSDVYECTSTVSIVDKIAPVAICDGYIELALDANGVATLTPGQVDDGSYDNCGIASMSLSQTQFDTNSFPVELVRLDVTDHSNNTSSCWVEVYILGPQTISLICINSNIALPSSGTYTPTVEELLEYGPFYGWDMSFFLLDENNDTIPNNEITTSHLGQTITFHVIENNSGITCTGDLIIAPMTLVDCPDFFICDTLPWDAPVGDCNSGHTLTDFIEWPADLDIAECFYSPWFLENFTTVDSRNARPSLLGNCEFKDMVHSDVVFEFPDDQLKVLRTWLVVDWVTLNQYEYTQTILVDQADCATPIAVRNRSGQGVEHVNVYESVLTNDEGQAKINDNQYNGISAKLEGTIRDGVDLHDALSIQESLLGIRSLDDVQLKLADLNGDENVDAMDILEVDKIATMEYDPLTPEPWQFYGAKSDPSEELNLPVLAGDYYGSDVEIIGVKRGDINGDATNNGQLDPLHNVVDIDLFVEDQLLFGAVSYTVEFTIDDLENIGGQQLELVVDLNKVDIQNVYSPAFPDFSESNYSITDDNILLIYWRASDDVIIDEGVSGSEDIPILSLDLIASQNSILSTAIELNQSNRNTIARVNDDNRYAFSLNWVGQIISNTGNIDNLEDQISIAPNPGNNYVEFSIEGISNEELNLSVYNATGQLIQSDIINNSATKLITSQWAEGIYFYNVSDKQGFNSSGTFSIQH